MGHFEVARRLQTLWVMSVLRPHVHTVWRLRCLCAVGVGVVAFVAACSGSSSDAERPDAQTTTIPDAQVCEPGYVQEHGECVDFDACADAPCASGVVCTDLAPPSAGFVCGDCPAGFDDVDGDGTRCVNVNECDVGAHDCDTRASCSDTEGSFVCACPAVFDDVAGDGRRCIDRDTDEDGLTDAVEVEHGTNPEDADSDDDGLIDGAEDANHNGRVDSGETDPRDPNSDDDVFCDGRRFDNDGDGLDPVDACTTAIFVDGAAAAGGDGRSWVTAYQTLATATSDARPGEQIWVAEGQYTSDDGTAVLQMTAGVSVYGGFNGSEAMVADRKGGPSVLDGKGTLEHVVIGASDAVFDGFVVMRGNATAGWGDGGGMLNESVENLRVSHVVFHNNVAAGSGGAMQNRFASVLISDSTFTSNSADSHGGAINSQAMGIRVQNSTFMGNTADRGGAIYSRVWMLKDSTFANNSASQGGALYLLFGGRSPIHNLTFIDNARRGIASYNALLSTIENSSFWNTSVYHGPIWQSYAPKLSRVLLYKAPILYAADRSNAVIDSCSDQELAESEVLTVSPFTEVSAGMPLSINPALVAPCRDRGRSYHPQAVRVRGLDYSGGVLSWTSRHADVCSVLSDQDGEVTSVRRVRDTASLRRSFEPGTTITVVCTGAHGEAAVTQLEI